MKQYNDYNTTNFLDDADFIRYIKYRLDEDVKFWDEWLATNPPNANDFKEASASLMAMLSVKRIVPTPELTQQIWQAIEQQVYKIEKPTSKLRIGRIVTVAAAASVILFFSAYWYYNAEITITTQYAEQKHIVLPDNSEITLNANSSITYFRAWKWHGKREVWLNGEGLFDIKHINKDTTNILPNERFTVNVENLAVEVLGTTFTIKSRRNNILVALLKGKINVVDKSHDKSQILHPGEVLNYKDSIQPLATIANLTNQPQAWVNHEMLSSGMTVQEIINNYEDTYGYHIILLNPAQANKKIDGTISLKTEDGTLYTLANILNANIERSGKTIYLRPK